MRLAHPARCSLTSTLVTLPRWPGNGGEQRTRISGARADLQHGVPVADIQRGDLPPDRFHLGPVQRLAA
ncbi:hypothetical protein Ahu01nite_063540 [Winogradskya humida]|uniref:Uncharacterized protein n=1 Tax=Winogradskya humida TaxID=113566 RepID=A0ABQ3ZXB5_9ACTN|nr:hypothetical protein Ahu01nite_063540 [Actinoplanes humidus]